VNNNNNNNTIHLNNSSFVSVENIMSNLQTKIKNIKNNLNAQYGSYADLLQSAKEKIAQNKTKSTADMTMEEYKEYINNKLQSMKRDFTRFQDSETVFISDAGFEAMKNDPDYETWVLDVVQQNLNVPNYLFGWKNSARISIHQFGATKEEYRGQSYSSQNDKPSINNETEDFWTLRRKRMKKLIEMQKEMFDDIYELKQLSEHKAEVKSAQMKAEGLIDTSNPMPIIKGIPAKFLLGMLSADTKI